MALQDFEELDKIFSFLQMKHPNPNRKDYLSILPSEILIPILADVPLSSYLDICHTSKTLKSFMQHFARELCNARILAHFKATAISLESYYIDGWILPTISFLMEWERRTECNEWRRKWNRCKGFDYKIKITESGPQFAAMLEEGRVAFEGPRGGLQAREDRLAESLERWNGNWGVKADGTIDRFVRDRRLAWYYGFPTLGCIGTVEKKDQSGESSEGGKVVVSEEGATAEVAKEDQPSQDSFESRDGK